MTISISTDVVYGLGTTIRFTDNVYKLTVVVRKHSFGDGSRYTPAEIQVQNLSVGRFDAFEVAPMIRLLRMAEAKATELDREFGTVYLDPVREAMSQLRPRKSLLQVLAEAVIDGDEVAPGLFLDAAEEAGRLDQAQEEGREEVATYLADHIYQPELEPYREQILSILQQFFPAAFARV